MTSGNPGWHKDVVDYDALPAIEKNEAGHYVFNDTVYKEYEKMVLAHGYIEEYWNGERCYSGLINTPGISLLPTWLMGPAYLIFLIYMFLGISISSDIFMEAIENITSVTSVQEFYDSASKQKVFVEVPVWNPTMANLTLMAFGSSAPEIILSTLEACKDLGNPAGELGPSTIVGSAAFNLLVISGVSIAAVGGEDGFTKNVDDLGVFVITSVSSIFAYVWLYLCLAVNTPDQVTVSEASWTLSFFFILLILAFSADKYNQKKKKNAESAAEQHELKIKQKKSTLRNLARIKGKA